MKKTLTFDQIKSVMARSLYNTLYRENNPPPDELRIPYAAIHPVPDEEDTATARVTYVVNCPGRKVHTVNIKFKYENPSGKFLRSTMTYV